MCKGDPRKGKDLEGGCYMRLIVNASGSLTDTGAAICLRGSNLCMLCITTAAENLFAGEKCEPIARSEYKYPEAERMEKRFVYAHTITELGCNLLHRLNLQGCFSYRPRKKPIKLH